MTDKWTDRLSEFLDGDMDAQDRVALDGHLEDCDSCTELLAELHRVAVRARALEDREPVQDLWTGIAARIGSKRQNVSRAPRFKRVSVQVPQLLAAGIAISLLSAGSVWFALSDSATDFNTPMVNLETPVYAANVSTRFDNAVFELEQVLLTERDRLNPATVRIVEENLAIINRAIQGARRALADDPESEFLREHLERTVQQKYSLLRGATTRGAAL